MNQPFQPTRLLLALMMLICSFQAWSQDIHFSQFYATPLNLNPALAGVINGNYRAAGVYRNQWGSVSTPYLTIGCSFDSNIPIEGFKDVVGAGLNVVNDRSGDGKLGMLHISLSGAFHKKLDKNGKHFIGIGIQPGYVQRTLSPNDLTFPNQFDGTNFDRTIFNNENFGKNSIGFFDLNSGLLYSANISKRVGVMQGVSVYHLTKPKESFLRETVRLENRFTVHGGLRIKLTELLYLTPNYIFMFQNQAQQVNFGTAVEFHLGREKEPFVFGIGGWYRLNDATIASLSGEYKNMRLGVSYDFNISELNPATNTRGGFELTLIYTGLFAPQDLGPVLVPCPRL